MAVAKRRRRVALLLCLMTLGILAGCAASGDRSDDSDQRPVFYGGVGGSALSR